MSTIGLHIDTNFTFWFDLHKLAIRFIFDYMKPFRYTWQDLFIHQLKTVWTERSIPAI